MDAAEDRQISDMAASPVCSTSYFEDAYVAMELESTDPLQKLDNNSDVPVDTMISHGQTPVDVSSSPLSTTLEATNDDRVIKGRRVESVGSQMSDVKQEEVQFDQIPDTITNPDMATTPSNALGKLASTHTAQYGLLEQTPEPQAEPSKSLDTRPMGEVRFHDGGMDYRESPSERWLPAEYHYNLRTMFIMTESERGGEYDFPDPQGKDAYDITTFHAGSKHWGPTWENRPPILKRFARSGYPVPSYDPGVMTDRGRVVIDQQNHAVINWRELPICISSKVPGYKMEAWRRLNPKISTSDFVARMPKTDKPVLTERNKLSMRMTRFRLRGACISWIEREGCQAIREYMANLIGPACVTANSIEGFGRDLTDVEVAAATAANKGKFPERAHRNAKREALDSSAGSKQQAFKLESDHEEDEDVKLGDEDEYLQAQGPRPSKRPVPPPVRPAFPLVEAAHVNESAPETTVQRQFPRYSRGNARTMMQTPSRSVAPEATNQPQQPRYLQGNPSARMQIQHRPIFRRNAISLASPMMPRLSRLHDEYRRRETIGDRMAANPAHTAPRNRAEVASIQRALRFARDEFILHYSEEAPLTDNRQSYWMQFQELQIAFVQRWFYPGPPPELTRITNWGESVMEWWPPRPNHAYQNFQQY